MTDYKHLSRRATDRKPNHVERRKELLGVLACVLLTVIGTMAFLITLTDTL